ncbi:hypothetical protein LIER_19819 [Lithospermum erythrorhizon]|uniref:RNase H type-1 domain-containing protein n=1 Tax=Lithospermum erythrorhizon TaxID=34254 RepID=A0AAV3QMW3_LITER
MSMPLSKHHIRDRVIWNHTKNGEGHWKNFREWWNHLSPSLDDAAKVEILEKGRWGGTVQQGRWQAPDQQWLKINCDASWMKHNRRCSIGVVVRGVQGCFKGARFNIMSQVSSALVAVAMAVREGMLFAKENNWNRVVIESDSSTLIQALKGEIGTPLEVDVLVWDVQQWSKNMEVKFQFTRTSNNAAHLVAHWDCGLEQQATWLDVQPHWLLATLQIVDIESADGGEGFFDGLEGMLLFYNPLRTCYVCKKLEERRLASFVVQPIRSMDLIIIISVGPVLLPISTLRCLTIHVIDMECYLS